MKIGKRISRALFSLKQVKHVLPLDSLRNLYFALIHPHLSYGNLAWGNADKNVIRKLTLLQKRAIRTINRSEYNSHTEPKFRSSRIMKLCDLYEYDSLLFMYDYRANNLPKLFDGHFPLNRDMPSARNTRQSSLFKIPFMRSNFSRKSPSFTFPTLWNEWAKRFSDNWNRPQFKRFVKKQILNGYAEFQSCDNLGCRECHK